MVPVSYTHLVDRTQIERGQVLAKPGSVHPHKTFESQVYVLTKDEEMCIRDSRETIRKEANQETKYARQSGGKGQYGHCIIDIEPNEPGKGYEFINAVVGGDVPKEFIPAIDQGIQGAMKAGILAQQLLDHIRLIGDQVVHADAQQ